MSNLREEKIKQRAKEIQEELYDGFYSGHIEGYQRAFIEGVQWADNHPRKGLVDIEKVCDWLRNNFEHYAYNYGIGEVIVGLTEAMEE
mgnify:CR=1 FL=1